MRTAIILFNLGGPDKLAAVRPFLFNLFNDPAIIRLPQPARFFLAQLISRLREKKAKDIYAQIGGRSPIRPNTEAQAAALEETLAHAGQFKCFTAMRYTHPFADEAACAVKDFAPGRVILLPLYPQFSTTTTQSSFDDWAKAARKAGLNAPTCVIRDYPDELGFIASMTQAAQAPLQEARKHGKPRLLFSAHGLPEKIVQAGDPYPGQCLRTARALAAALGASESEWVLCYQSRVGPLRWIGPSTEEEIARAGRDKLPVVIVPIAFTGEHSETLYEIDILYRELAAAEGVPYFTRAATPGTAPAFIKGLAQLVRAALAGKE